MEQNFNVSYSSNLVVSANIYMNYPIEIIADHEFGNLLVEFKDRKPVKDAEGEAFVIIGVDERGRLSYISIIPDDEDLKKLIKEIKNA
ncbi:hypothetical protein V6M85_11750 [Sulfolobus tengchongensis]|uniref:DUF2283 domain-containing protein n=1 Tax=Sulfolobus tengchongensis TaxID=207809 RepID=A0AAX4KYW2_9CREN